MIRRVSKNSTLSCTKKLKEILQKAVARHFCWPVKMSCRCMAQVRELSSKVWTVNLNLSRISPSSIPSWHLAYKFKLPMEFYFLCNVYRVSHDRFVVNAAWPRHSRFWSWYIFGLWVAENVSSYTLSELKICWSSWTLKALWSVLMKDFSQFNSHKYKALYSQKSAWLILSLAKLSRPLTLKMSCCFKQETKDGVLFISSPTCVLWEKNVIVKQIWTRQNKANKREKENEWKLKDWWRRWNRDRTRMYLGREM